MNGPNKRNTQKTTRKALRHMSWNDMRKKAPEPQSYFTVPELTPCEHQCRPAWKAVHSDGSVQVFVGSYEDALAAVRKVIDRANARERYFRSHSTNNRLKLL